MNKPARTVEWLVWSALALTILGVFATFAWKRISARTSREDLPVLFQVPDFTLTNQNEGTVTLADLRGYVWLVDVIFTRCGGPCPGMTRKMSEIQTKLPPSAPVKLISLTTDPEYDAPAVLKRYSQRFGAQPGRWQFLTGTKAQISDLAVGGLKFTAIEKEPGTRESSEDLFIHSTTIVLVDARGRMRASFETEQPDSPQKILSAVKRLLRESKAGVRNG